MYHQTGRPAMACARPSAGSAEGRAGRCAVCAGAAPQRDIFQRDAKGRIIAFVSRREERDVVSKGLNDVHLYGDLDRRLQRRGGIAKPGALQLEPCRWTRTSRSSRLPGDQSSGKIPALRLPEGEIVTESAASCSPWPIIFPKPVFAPQASPDRPRLSLAGLYGGEIYPMSRSRTIRTIHAAGRRCTGPARAGAGRIRERILIIEA